MAVVLIELTSLTLSSLKNKQSAGVDGISQNGCGKAYNPKSFKIQLKTLTICGDIFIFIKFMST